MNFYDFRSDSLGIVNYRITTFEVNQDVHPKTLKVHPLGIILIGLVSSQMCMLNLFVCLLIFFFDKIQMLHNRMQTWDEMKNFSTATSSIWSFRNVCTYDCTYFKKLFIKPLLDLRLLQGHQKKKKLCKIEDSLHK